MNLILAIVAMSYDDCRKKEELEAEEELASALVIIVSALCFFMTSFLSVFRLFFVCFLSVFRMFFVCFSSVFRLFFVCFSSVFRLYFVFFSSVFRLFFVCFSSVFRLFFVCFFLFFVCCLNFFVSQFKFFWPFLIVSILVYEFCELSHSEGTSFSRKSHSILVHCFHKTKLMQTFNQLFERKIILRETKL